MVEAASLVVKLVCLHVLLKADILVSGLRPSCQSLLPLVCVTSKCCLWLTSGELLIGSGTVEVFFTASPLGLLIF